MINSFSQYLVEEERAVYFTFGRMNPPTIGHGKLLDSLATKSGRNPYKVFLSQSTDPKKNPLSYSDKVKHVRKMFPKHARSVMINKKVKTAIDAVVSLHNEGYKRVVMIVGQDRVREFDILLNKYNGKQARHGFYNFESIKVVSAGQRDPDSEGAEGASATKQRQAAKENDFTTFGQGLPNTMSNANAKRLYNDVRKGMGLKEATDFKNHVQLKPVSELREKYVNEGIFQPGDTVHITKKDIIGNIKHLGANYVIVEANNQTWRCWLTDVTKINEKTDRWYKDQPEWGTPESTKKAKKKTPGEDMKNESLWANIHAKRARGEKMRKKGAKGAPTPAQMKRAQAASEATVPQDGDIADRKGTQPAKYHKGLAKATKVARDRQFKKQSKMADNNPAAYKPAPGDAGAKTKPSKYTKFVKRLMGESFTSWEHDEPVEYAKTLTKAFGQPDELTNSQCCWFNIDGFKRVVVKDEYILHSSPSPHYDFVYSYVDLQVPKKYAEALAESSESIMIDFLKGEVGARCGTLSANAHTLNYCLDVVAERVKPSKQEYEKRIKGIRAGSGPDWWPNTMNEETVHFCIHEKKNQNAARERIKREKELDKAKHDRMMDRARLRDTRAKNMQTESSFADKSKASGISTGTLRKVYQRGVAAWKTGHRPGTTPSQWGHARVNAFIAKKKKGNLNHDKDLA